MSGLPIASATLGIGGCEVVEMVDNYRPLNAKIELSNRSSVLQGRLST